MSPDGSQPGTHAEWMQQAGQDRGWQAVRLSVTGNPFDDRVDILIEDSLVATLGDRVDTLIADLVAEGYEVAAFSTSGGSAELLRAFLRTELDSGLVAATLIGDLPVPWYQLIDDFQGSGANDGYEEFPCDLFLMDLDGAWTDSFVRLDSLDSLVPGTDRIYDGHTGHVVPEIGVSRLPVRVINRGDTLLPAYLDRAHAYRTGGLTVPHRALVYIDDDWYNSAWYWDRDVGLLFDQRTSMWDRETTRAADYRPRIDSAPFQWLQLCAHSWPGGHTFYYDNRTRNDWFYGYEIPDINPAIQFFNLFACSNSRYTESDFCGGRYVLETENGLGSIGSAKTGSMLEFGDFYGPLGQGKPLALGFRDWFRAQGEDSFEIWEKSWFYGMALIGDGTLVPGLCFDDVSTDAVLVPAENDTFLLGEEVAPFILTTNRGQRAADFNLRFSIGDFYADTITTSLGAGGGDKLPFQPWTVDRVGTFVAACSTMLDGDQRFWNDRDAVTFHVVDPSGIVSGPHGDPTGRALHVLQNPARDNIHCRLEHTGAAPLKVRVIDALGREVARELVHPAGTVTDFTIRAQHLSPGVYFLQATVGSGQPPVPLRVLLAD